MQVKLTKISYIGTLFKVWFIQGSAWTGFTVYPVYPAAFRKTVKCQ
jgi:hypothetical protein